ncbi:hypothetical protein J4050_05085 [Winogradskyella sp. DF17]|uniref:Uncharacterized protein n=1 Tax=Winogradskyella pelagia TaxID=2819984 RepID=A0ABS3T1G5_9FLAO|nr:DUF6090 family protein [Winogradskyella sp. DF17]MBO3116109.1 hypothetical protein [Winogradskyella sp. DF17]
MIKFFRKIRYELMNQNKTTKYFKYAIGEIILVVIGILIALQINNWNQDRLNTKIETETLINLKQDLDSALVQLNNKIFQNHTYRTYDSIAMELIQSKRTVSNDSMYKLLMTHIYTPTFDPEVGTLNEIISTGKMDIIKSKGLRSHISSWNRYMDELDEVDKRLIYLDDNVKTPLYSKYLSYRNSFNLTINPNSKKTIGQNVSNSNFNVNFESFFYTLQFENMFSNYVIYGRIQHGRLIDVKHKMTEMIDIIEDSFNND